MGSGRSRWRRHRAVPPVTPNACVQDAVLNATLSHLWSEVIAVLHPLLDAIRENSQGGRGWEMGSSWVGAGRTIIMSMAWRVVEVGVAGRAVELGRWEWLGELLKWVWLGKRSN